MSGDEMHELGERARRREAEREAYLASDEAAELIAPPSAEERQRLLRAVLPPARADAHGARRSPWTWAVGGLAFAAATAAVVVLSLPTSALPSYSVRVDSIGYSEVRGEPAPTDGSAKVAVGMAFEVVLQPAESFRGALAARVVIDTEGRVAPLAWSPELASTGAVRFRGEIGREVMLPLGRSRLGFVVGAPSAVEAWTPGAGDDPARAVLWLAVEVVP